jgi:hypothetical protein
MAYLVRPDGTIEAESVEEAISISRRLAGAPPVPGPVTPTPAPPSDRVPSQADKRVRELLEFILAAGADGITGQAIAEHLGLENARGLSGYIQAIRKEIRRRDGKVEACIAKERTRDGARWYAFRKPLNAIGLAE